MTTPSYNDTRRSERQERGSPDVGRCAKVFRALRRRIAASALAVTTLAGIATLAPAARAGATTATGGINTGNPGSTCAPSNGGLNAAPLEPGTSNTWLGQAPAYYEVGAPSGAYAGKAPKGIVLVVHGGGWYVVGAGAVTAERSVADDWRNNGYSTINFTYPACNGPGEIATLEWFYDIARRVAPTLRIGAEGDSAGGNLVLLLAEHRSMSFTISRGGPTDLTSIASQPAWNPPDATYDQTAGPQMAYNWAVAAFGTNGLAAMSPALSSTRPSGRVLQAPTSVDVFVPQAQLSELGLGTLDVVTGPGPVQWVHGTVTVAGAWAFVAVRNLMLSQL